MNIIWHGHSCFTLEDKINGVPVSIVTDPYDNSIGLRLPKLEADLVSVSHAHEDHNNVEAVNGADGKSPIVINRPGEYEVKKVFALGIGSYHDKSQGAERGKSVMFKFDFDGVKILHLGDLGSELSDQQLERIDDVDVLLIPVGGKYTINAAEAAEIVREIEPRIVIPMHYQLPGMKLDLDPVEKFRKAMGNKAETMNKLKISKKDLPSDEIKLVILEKA
ncbi:MBL fold metallo-hydrolase [Candidatus Falkowbacteria bacterium]|nr:MBL fold metallo-hydrolase [Candidatus Falkowbacteria bacterium]